MSSVALGVVFETQPLFVVSRDSFSTVQAQKLVRKFAQNLQQLQQALDASAPCPNGHAGEFQVWGRFVGVYQLVGDVHVVVFSDKGAVLYPAVNCLALAVNLLGALCKGSEISHSLLLKKYPEMAFALERLLYEDPPFHNARGDASPTRLSAASVSRVHAGAWSREWKFAAAVCDAQRDAFDREEETDFYLPTTSSAKTAGADPARTLPVALVPPPDLQARWADVASEVEPRPGAHNATAPQGAPPRDAPGPQDIPPPLPVADVAVWDGGPSVDLGATEIKADNPFGERSSALWIPPELPERDPGGGEPPAATFEASFGEPTTAAPAFEASFGEPATAAPVFEASFGETTTAAPAPGFEASFGEPTTAAPAPVFEASFGEPTAAAPAPAFETSFAEPATAAPAPAFETSFAEPATAAPAPAFETSFAEPTTATPAPAFETSFAEPAPDPPISSSDSAPNLFGAAPQPEFETSFETGDLVPASEASFETLSTAAGAPAPVLSPPAVSDDDADEGQTAVSWSVTESALFMYRQGRLQRCAISGQVAVRVHRVRGGADADVAVAVHIQSATGQCVAVEAAEMSDVRISVAAAGSAVVVRSAGAALAEPVVVARYRIRETVEPEIMRVLSAWKVTESHASLLLQYAVNPGFDGALTDVRFLVALPKDADVARVQLKPVTGAWNSKQMRLLWKVAEAVDPTAGLVKLYARFDSSRPAAISESTVAARYECRGDLLSDVAVEVVGADGDDIDVEGTPETKFTAKVEVAP